MLSERYLDAARLALATFSIGFLLVIYSIAKCLWAVHAKLERSEISDKSKLSFTYFLHISETPAKDYFKKMGTIDKKAYDKELLIQTHILAKISTAKHTQFNEAILCFITGVAVAVLSIIFIII